MPRPLFASLTMPQLLLIALSVVALFMSTIVDAGELKPGTPYIITLSNGEVVYDLNGE